MIIHLPQTMYHGGSERYAEGLGRQRLAWELEVAREVQVRLFPQEQPRCPGVDYFGAWRAAWGVSGDYLDYPELTGGNLGLALGDVAGKGVSAALLMSSLHSMVRTLGVSSKCTLSDLVGTINRHFLRISPSNCFATLFLASYDPFDHTLRFVNAGHEPPVVLRKSEGRYRIISLEPGGPVVGMVTSARYIEQAVTLTPGDIVVAYTDGVTDVHNRSGAEWGLKRLLDVVTGQSGNMSAREIVGLVLAAMDAFADGEPQYDDLTLWVARVGEAEAVAPVEREEEYPMQEPELAMACAA